MSIHGMRRRPDFFAAKLIVITGGTSGIGLALAHELSRRRAKVIVVADKAESILRALTELRASDYPVDGYMCDIGNADQVTETCSRILDEHGIPDILINNAGYAIYRTFEQEESDELERLMSVNFGGAVRITKAF